MGERIFVADDDADVRRFVEISLASSGFEVTSVSNGPQLMDLAVAAPPDLVLLDVMMPDADGYEICRRLRSDPRTATVSIIMLTGRSLTDDKIAGLSAGADDYILKPFDPRELVARVKTTLQRARDLRDVNPLSGLPGNVAIVDQLMKRIGEGEEFALMHVDLDQFKAFNDHYGFARGDEAIKFTSSVIRKSSGDRSFVGHVGGDDFVVIADASRATSVAEGIIESFDQGVGDLYEPGDLERGRISVTNRRGEREEYPIMTISIGIATNATRRIASHLEAGEIAAELKEHAKTLAGSAYAVDRRRDR